MFKCIFIIFLISIDLYAQVLGQSSKVNIPLSIGLSKDIGDVFNARDDLLNLRSKIKYPDSEDILMNEKMNKEIFLNKSVSDRMSIIKYHIINGNLDKAKAKILQAQYLQDYSSIIQKRYLAIIHFIEGDYQNSLNILQDNEFYSFDNNKHVCLLRVLNYLILNRNIEALDDWKICRDATVNKTSSYHLWMNALIELKANKTKIKNFKTITNLNIENETGEMLTLFLKLALYLDVPNIVLDRLSYLSDEIYQDEKLRELIGLLYFRDKQLVNAYSFVEDLDTPNSENLKGNLYLAQKKYELAYAQYKLALAKKSDSQNALERITPTAWILRQWKDGLKFIKKLNVSEDDYFQKLAIQAAFEIQAQDYKGAKISLTKIIQSSLNSQAPEVNVMNSFVHLKLNEKMNTIDYADKACKNLDGLNCWLQFQLLIWQDFTLSAKRDDEVIDVKESLLKKYKNSYQNEPIKEKLLIDQKDIEELDTSLISIMPN